LGHKPSPTGQHINKFQGGGKKLDKPDFSGIKTTGDRPYNADYISYIRGISLYSVDVEVTTDSRIVTLSTCTNVSDDERLLVHAVKIAEDPMVETIEE
jgi:sortase B